MTIPIIYISLFILTIVLFFVKKDWTIKYKKTLTYAHLTSLLILSVDILLITKFKSSFRTIWADRVFAIGLLISGAMIFAFYRKTFKWWTKIYFGVFFFYPVIAALTFLGDRIFFILVASPLLATLISPSTYYSDYDYEIRTPIGMMAPNRLVLIKKNVLTETEIGMSDEETIEGNYKMFNIIITNKDSTKIMVYIDGQATNLTFR